MFILLPYTLVATLNLLLIAEKLLPLFRMSIVPSAPFWACRRLCLSRFWEYLPSFRLPLLEVNIKSKFMKKLNCRCIYIENFALFSGLY